MKIEIESEALDSIKAMAQRLQDERDEALALLQDAHSMLGSRLIKDTLGYEWHEKTLSIIAKCTAEPKVME